MPKKINIILTKRNLFFLWNFFTVIFLFTSIKEGNERIRDFNFIMLSQITQHNNNKLIKKCKRWRYISKHVGSERTRPEIVCCINSISVKKSTKKLLL